MKLSVIIPAFNEEKNIKACIESAKKLKPLEIIVVDGGSTDMTKKVASDEGAFVIQSPKGRGIQMNRGASSANGEMLLFLHADSVLGYHCRANGNLEVVFEEILDSCWSLPRTSIRGRNDKKNYVGGFFRLKFDDNSISTWLVELFANLRARLFSLPYGDQALYIRRDVFDKLNGFREYPFLEDIDFVIRLKKYGHLKYMPHSAIASARRLKKGYPLSPIIVSLRNVAIALLFVAGISPQRLIKFYR